MSVFVYDGDCGFCKRWVKRFERFTDLSVEFIPSEVAEKQFPEIPPSEFSRCVHFFDEGQHLTSAKAIFHVLSGGGWIAFKLINSFYDNCKLFRWVSEYGYKLIANHRLFLSRFM